MDGIYQPGPCNYDSPRVRGSIVDSFDKGNGLLSTCALSGQLCGYLFEYPNRLLIATDASAIDAAAGSGVYIPQLSLQYFVRLLQTPHPFRTLNSYPYFSHWQSTLLVPGYFRSFPLVVRYNGINKQVWRFIENEITDALVKAVLALPSLPSIRTYELMIMFETYKHTMSSYAELDHLTFP